MKISRAHNSACGQTSLEYLLLLAVVAVVVIASFRPGSLISQVHDASQGYYNKVTRVIMGENPHAIRGGWCGITCPAAGFGFSSMYNRCECPQPAFGGAYCDPPPGSHAACGPGQTSGKDCPQGAIIDCTQSQSCGPCPNGQVCLPPDGHCGCSNGLVCGGQCTPGCTPVGSPQCCSPANSIPIDCQTCGCPPNSILNTATNSCGLCPVCFVADPTGKLCVPIDCSTKPNMSCDKTLNP
ncbi:MAG: class III signal peptide-containing protein, partial [Candidatus Omnitrophica bacterium]|nr:class III signal peptide-containing protein [Candidatus Omnitrophota bacterium]